MFAHLQIICQKIRSVYTFFENSKVAVQHCSENPVELRGTKMKKTKVIFILSISKGWSIKMAGNGR
jgi:hypothetical protein